MAGLSSSSKTIRDGWRPGNPSRLVVADAMLGRPSLCSTLATVDDIRRLFANDHIHAALLVEGGRLLAVVERRDLVGALGSGQARHRGRLVGRTVGADVPLNTVYRWMNRSGARRLAVVDPRGELLGLLCLKAKRNGFCSADDVAERAKERAAFGAAGHPSANAQRSP